MTTIPIRRLTTQLGVALATLLAFNANGQTIETPQTRLKPIDAPSAVDRYRSRDAESVASANRFRETGYREFRNGRLVGAPVRQAAWLQQAPGFNAPSLPQGGGFQLPSNDAAPVPSPSLPSAGGSSQPLQPFPQQPQTSPPRTLPSNPNANQPVPSSSDLTPLAAPHLSSGFATVGNCCCVSPPSSYSAASGIGCGPPVTYAAPPAYIPPPTEIAAPAAMPPAVVPAVGAVPAAAPHRPLFSFGQELNPVELGQGIIGQPVAYVPGQPVRNFLRYISP